MPSYTLHVYRRPPGGPSVGQDFVTFEATDDEAAKLEAVKRLPSLPSVDFATLTDQRGAQIWMEEIPAHGDPTSNELPPGRSQFDNPPTRPFPRVVDASQGMSPALRASVTRADSSPDTIVSRDESVAIEAGSEIQADAVVIPAAMPGSHLVAWDHGRLTVVPDDVESDLGVELVPLLRALRTSIDQLVARMDSEPSNIDRRLRDFIDDLRDLVPAEPPDRAGLYQMGFAGDDLAGLAVHAAAEWPPDLMTRYQALVRQFGRILGSFRLWREYSANPAVASLTREQVEVAASLPAKLQSAVATPQAQALFDVTISNALFVFNRQTANISVGGVGSAADTAGKRKAFNIVAFAGNILRELIQKAFVDSTYQLITQAILTSPAWVEIIDQLISNFPSLMDWLQSALRAIGVA